MISYGFYKDAYLGASIPEAAFPGLMMRAQAWLENLERVCRVVSYGEESQNMALCALAEVFYAYGGRQGISQTSVGGVTVRYEQDQAPLQRRLLQSVAGYLEVYRGVG